MNDSNKDSNKKCPQEDCWAPEIACNLGWDLDSCPHYKEVAAHSEDDKNTKEDSFLLPWLSNSLGLVDLQFIAGRSKPIIIGIIGGHNAGKTTLLTTIYLLLTQGQRATNRQFGGSFTFGGWEHLAHALRWMPHQAPHFPAHTPNNAGRLPGLLHLAFRMGHEEFEDVLLTDAPGEWFERWSVDKEASDIEGARWISKYADVFMFLVDSEALSGPDRGEARTNTLNLAQRLSSELMGRPVAVVWSKSDIPIREVVQAALMSKFSELFPRQREFRVSVEREQSHQKISADEFIELLSWILEEHTKTTSEGISLTVQKDDDPLLAFRG
jgi:hypothetical protein